MYRLTAPERIRETKWNAYISKMKSFLSRQEAQVAIRIGAPHLYSEYGFSSLYAQNNKFSLLKRIHENEATHCHLSGYDDLTTELDTEDIEECGGVYRLPYYSMLPDELQLTISAQARKDPRRHALSVLECILAARLMNG
eukprot:GHVO01013700.1.p1 GENE.GHVO01013700.1~~GHVO01013700.1.p1  ORF type:complete len:140 (+),score=14.66 GHVO01013700.1:173-592(+)